MDNGNIKKNEQLGIPHGTANSKLKKILLFNLVKKLNLDVCFQCGKKIESLEEFSIEHKIPWLDSEDPQKLFYDLNNIAYSHLKCNVGAARQTRILKHPSQQSYKDGCKCNECREIQRLRIAKQRLKYKEEVL